MKVAQLTTFISTVIENDVIRVHLQVSQRIRMTCVHSANACVTAKWQWVISVCIHVISACVPWRAQICWRASRRRGTNAARRRTRALRSLSVCDVNLSITSSISSCRAPSSPSSPPSRSSSSPAAQNDSDSVAVHLRFIRHSKYHTAKDK